MVFKRRDRKPFSSRLRQLFFPRGGWRRGLEYLSHRVRRLPDTPHRIALGVSCGVFASFSPFFGLHIIYAIALAWAVRANMFAALVGTVVGNPLTFPLIAPVALGLGRRILGFGATGRDFGRVAEAFGQALSGGWHSLLALVGRGEGEWHKVAVFLRDVVWPYFLGGLLPGLVAAIASYYLARPLIVAYQSRRRSRLRALARRRAGRRIRSEAGGSA